MYLRYMAFSVPVLIFIVVVMPFMIFTIPIFLGAMSLVWIASWWFTNALARTYTPDYYDTIKKGGGDPFLDNLGEPLNFDSDEVRQRGLSGRSD